MSDDIERWIIGGAARCGKSYLAAEVSKSRKDMFVLTVDALLHVYLTLPTINNEKQAASMLREWMQRRRYMDAAKTQSRAPVDDCYTDIEVIIEAAALTGAMSPVAVIFAGLDAIVRLQGQKGWLILDLHPELYFEKYRSFLPNLRLLVILRDPVEAVAASLYWRTYPERTSRDFRYFVGLWRLAALTTAQLANQYSLQVFYVSTSQIFSSRFEAQTGLPYVSDKISLYFTSKRSSESGNTLFLLPQGEFHELIFSSELTYISRCCNTLFSAVETGTLSSKHFSVWFSLLGPRRAKWLIDFRYNPKQMTIKFIYRLHSLWCSRSRFF